MEFKDNMKRIGKELSKSAKNHGICDDWNSQLMLMDDKDALIDMYLRGIDFCIRNDYPSNDYIRQNFKGSMEHKGVFLDDIYTVKNLRKVVLLGKSSGDVEFTDYHVARIFCKHESITNIVVNNHAIVRIDAFDNSVVKLNCSGSAKVTVNLFGEAKVFNNSPLNARVRIVYKNKKTY